MQDRPSVKPLWGFGWVGWCLLPVAVFLAWSLISGFDLRQEFLRAIDRWFGIDAVDWIVAYALTAHSLSDFGFSLVTLCAALVAMHLSPRRFAWWWYFVLTTWALVRPFLVWQLMVIWCRPVIGSGVLWAPPWKYTVVMGGSCFIDLAILVALSRSWIVTGGSTLVMALAAFLAWTAQASLIQGNSPVGFEAWLGSWHAYIAQVLLGTSLLAWGLRDRFRSKPPWACGSCGYDLRGLAGDTCPECGARSANNIAA